MKQLPKAITDTQDILALLNAGEIVGVGEYRQFVCEETQWRDSVTRLMVKGVVKRETVELGQTQRTCVLQSYLPDGTNPADVARPHNKGDKVCIVFSSVMQSKGTANGRGDVIPITEQ